MRVAPVAIAGAGPAGLAAALTLVRKGTPVAVYEAGARVGGIARTEEHRGYRFDIGGHRFLTKVPEVHALWSEVLGADFIRVPRLSRIYYGGRFFDYPLSLPNVLGNLGPVESARIAMSYLRARLWPVVPEESLEAWVTNRFGDRLYRTFFKTYTEKVWGLPCHVLRADWAAQRIRGLSLTRAVSHAIFRGGSTTSLTGQFHYPRLGPGQMWERFAALVEAAGSTVRPRTRVSAVHHRDGRVRAITVHGPAETTEVPVTDLVSSIALPELLRALDPAPPPPVLDAAARLRFRDFLIVVLIVNRDGLFPDNWIYVHTPAVRVGRIQNFKNWSPAMVPDQRTTSLGMENFCSEGDDIWERTGDELVTLASAELETLGLSPSASVIDGCVLRQRRAYPVYDGEYRQHVETIRRYLAGFDNLQTIGRNGMHRYNNQDHSMLTGILAARNVLGESHDLWDVNTERSYYEEHLVSRLRAG